MLKKYIVLHHSATKDGVYRDFDSLLRGHLARGYRDIGYHYVIEKVQGELAVIPGRAEWEEAAACPGKNFDAIHICVVGNFQETVPGSEIYPVVANLCKQIMARHPIQEIGGHRDYMATACPGKHFDVKKVKEYIKREAKKYMDIKAFVGDKEIRAKLINNETWVPLREYTKILFSYKVIWDSNEKTAIVKRE